MLTHMQEHFSSGQLGGYLRQLTLHQLWESGSASNSGVGLQTWDLETIHLNSFRYVICICNLTTFYLKI